MANFNSGQDVANEREKILLLSYIILVKYYPQYKL